MGSLEHDSHDVDVAIVGGGAAGLNGALVLARAGRSVMVIDAGMPRNRFASHMQGYLSRDGMPPSELLAIGRQEVEGYGGVVIQGEVVAVDADTGSAGERFTLTLAGGSQLTARRVLVTTGLRDELPEIDGVAERWGKDVLHCPYCHGYEVRDQPLGVIATGPLSVHQGLLIRQWSADLIFFANGMEVADADRENMEARGTQIVPGRVRRLVIADDRLTGVELEDGTIIARTALFVTAQFVAADSLLAHMGAEIQSNEFASWVIADRMGLTTVPGVWAAGNVADPMAQVINAAAAGGLAAAAINMDLVNEDVRDAVTATTTTARRRAPLTFRVGEAGRDAVAVAPVDQDGNSHRCDR